MRSLSLSFIVRGLNLDATKTMGKIVQSSNDLWIWMAVRKRGRVEELLKMCIRSEVIDAGGQRRG
ncbi:MAG: hypothetical protein AAGE99_03990 [Chlamydiota bacterium]